MSRDRKTSRLGRGLKNSLKKVKAESAISFQEALSPAVNFGLERLRSSVSPAAEKSLAASAWESLGRHLANRLAFALTPTLRIEQSATKAVGRSKITLLGTVRGFPGALETAAQLIADWIDAQKELLHRLVRDERLLRAFFLGNQKHFHVSAIHPGLSDPHDGGRTVTLIEFSGNRRVIYKPRSSHGEQLWSAALGWLNRNGIVCSFRKPDLIPRKNFCWMEFLRAKSCRSLTEVRLFYFRWGAQTALAEILAASDLHRENWIAAGSQPVLVDAEAIGDDRQLLPALLETGLLPLTSRDGAGFYRGIAPLDGTFTKNSPPNCWPRYKGVPQEPSKYLDDLIRGFEAVAEIFGNADLARKFFREITSRRARSANARVFFRSSAEYARILRESVEPYHMTSRSGRPRWLTQTCCSSSISRAVGIAEARALLRCDVPRFVRARRASISWKEFAATAARLKRSSSLLRRRVLMAAPQSK